ncbi:MAG: VCBS repeat-containing protein [Rhodopirellula sp.]|nr:VCBS repeat-containing protein [Rhodopirellula sp.]
MSDHESNSSTASSASLKRRVGYVVAGFLLAVAVAVILVGPLAEPVEDAISVDISKAELAKEKQKQIWAVEHFAFELETFFGKPLARAIGNGQWKALESRLMDSFSGSVFKDDSVATLVETTGIQQSSRTADRSEIVSVDVAGFVDAHKRLAGRLAETTKTNFRVLKLYRTSDSDNLWSAHFLMTLNGTAKNSSLTTIEVHSSAVLAFSDDAGIRSDALVHEWHFDSENVRSSPRKLMEEVSVTSNLDALPLIDNWTVSPADARQYWRQMAADDFDRDGFLDIAVASFVGRPLLLHHEADETYRDVAPEVGVKSWAVDDSHLVNMALWIDYDADGFPDLLMGDQLYHNEAGQQFTNVTAQSQLEIGHHPMGGVVADYDGDGDLDLYILYQHATAASSSSKPEPWVGDSMSGAENALWQNQGDGRFVNVTATSGCGGGARNSFAAVWHFHDDDHWPDLYVANDFGKNVHFRNRGDGTFEDISETTGTADFSTSMGVAAGDIDNDGHTEIYVANMYSKMGRRIIAHVAAGDYPDGVFQQIQGSCAGNRLYSRNDASSSYQELSEKLGINAVGWAYAPTFVDLDNDGWLDIYASTGFMSFDRRKPDG